jgi:hypothetical protein
MEKATIVTLGGEDTSPVTLDISSYEEAFGEYSNVFGKRARARRQARRKRREERKIERIGRRSRIKSARRQKRLDAMRDRQFRRTERKRLRLERRRLGEEPEGEDEEDLDTAPISSENGGGGESGGGYSEPETMGGGGYSGGGESGGGYSEPETMGGGGYSGGGTGGGAIDYGQAGEEWGGAPPNFGEEDGYEGDVYSNDNDGTGSPEGTGSESDFEGSMDDNYGEFAGGIKVSSKIAEITKKIEWNKELVSRLRVKRAEILGLNGDTSDIDNQISSRIARISELEGMLNRYSNFSDEFSYATDEELSDVDFIDGDSFSYANGTPKGLAKGMAIRKPTPRMVGRRKAEVKRAKIMAKRRRMNAVTQVQSNLNPQISPNQIVIPPSMGGTIGDVTDKNKTFKVTSSLAIKLKYNANSQQINPVGGGANGFYNKDTIIKGEPMKLVVRSGNNVIQYPVVKVQGTNIYVKQSDVTEISNMDGIEIDSEMMDFDAPAPRVVELSSSFDGGSKTDFTTLALGIGLGVLGVWAIGRLKTK